MEIDLELYRRDVLVSTAPRVRLSAIDAGPADADETLVFLHGFGGRALQWAYQLRHFAGEKRCIAIDLRGHGMSDAPVSAYTLDQLLTDIERVLDALRVRGPFVLLAHSFGGLLAASYALRRPDRVKKLVLVCVPDDYRLPKLLRLPLRLPGWLLNPVREGFRFYAPAHVVRQIYWTVMHGWDGPSVFSQLAVPTLVLIGQRDFTYPPSRYRAVGRLMPHAQVVTIPTSAHLAQLERPDAVNRAISRFIGTRPVSWREFWQPPSGAQRPWTRFYDVGVPFEIRPPVQPLDRFLTSAARRQPHRVATVFYGQTLTYRELDQAANRLANALLGQGIAQGDRVLVCLPNCPQAVITFYGILKAGAVTVMASPLATPDELGYLLRDSGAVHAVCLAPYLPRLAQAAQGTALRRVTVTHLTDYAPWDMRLLWRLRREGDTGEAGTSGAALPLPVDDFKSVLRVAPDLAPDLAVQPDDLACLHYTSGTTGEPKGVMLSHANLVANTVQARSWLPDVRYSGEVYLTVLPLWHSYGAMSAMSVPVSLAASMVILPRFDVAETLQAIQAYKPTLFPGVPSMYVAIKDFPDVRKYGISSIRACLSGAAPLPVEVQEAFEKLTRGRLVEGYGLTEAGPITHASPLGGRRRVGSIGLPLPGTDARIVDLATGLDLPPGAIGELCVAGPQVMRGYWNRPAETMAALRDGWLHTGDVARMDEDGFFQIVERKADLWPGVFAPDGAVIFPRDIEEVLYEHPKVQEAAVAAVDADGQAALKAFVVLRRGEHATPGEILDYARQRLPGPAIPRAVEFVKDLPKSPIGKVIRRLLVSQQPDEKTKVMDHRS